jgi:hypothetical protein
VRRARGSAGAYSTLGAATQTGPSSDPFTAKPHRLSSPEAAWGVARKLKRFHSGPACTGLPLPPIESVAGTPTFSARM